jgi:predicted anti-sigma-YlaC factor YlaD
MDVDRCSEWRALASCRLDEELDQLQTVLLERHLVECAACRAWTGEIAALATVLHDSTELCPEPPLELRPHALRRRLVRSASAVAAASAAAIAVFAMALPGAAISLFSSGRTPVVAPAPCTSCVKKQALTTRAPAPAAAPVHVAHPLVTE